MHERKFLYGGELFLQVERDTSIERSSVSGISATSGVALTSEDSWGRLANRALG